ncbi:MAG TPA: TatD family hydrolase [Terriglobales bacterium]|nr:TatD family hydrolase [Terriglobales bacterium]
MLIDAHSHLDRYEDKLESALEEIRQSQVFTLSNSMDLPSYHQNLDIAKKCDLVLPSFGIHPWNAPEYADQLEDLNEAVKQTPIIGEIGLDYLSAEYTFQVTAQRKVFEFFLKRAKEQNKLVNLHTRGAEKEVLVLLREYEIQRAIIHWYSGSLGMLDKLLDTVAYFTIGVEILNSEHIRKVAQKVPMERLLTETDNPGGLMWTNGIFGMPSVIKEVVQTVAEVRNTTDQLIIQTVEINFARLIQDDPWLFEIRGKFFRKMKG